MNITYAKYVNQIGILTTTADASFLNIIIDDGDMYEFLLPKIAERESLTVTGVVSPPTPE